MSTRNPKERALVWATLALAAYFILPHFLPESGPGGILRRTLAHPFVLLAAGFGVWFVVSRARRGQTRTALLALAGGAVIGAGFGAYKMRQWFPDHQLLSPSGYARAAKLLLGRDMLLSEYTPRPALVHENPSVLKARYPAIDVHYHLGSMDPEVTPERLIAAMDSTGIESVVNLDGMPPDLERFREWAARFPGRIINFAIPEWWLVGYPFFTAGQTAWIERAVELGAQGIKIPKVVGLGLRDTTGMLVPVDDARLDFLWELAGSLGLPVLIHSSDPTPFFQPVDHYNERYLELADHPDWRYPAGVFPPRDSTLAQRERVLRRHPNTIFIGAHLGMNADDLAAAGRLLDRYPNYHVDMSSQLMELGRQPRTAREFFIRYQDRIVFGTDGGFGADRPNWPIERFYRTHFQFLETDAEYFEYPLAEYTKQGNWRIYGIALPDSVLAKVYAGNLRGLLRSPDELAERLREVRARRVATGEPTGAACSGLPFRWARPAGEIPTVTGPDSADAEAPDFGGDSVRVRNYSFRPGRPFQILGNGQVSNGSGSTIELRGYRVEHLSPEGKVLGTQTCRVRLGYEHCGLGGTSTYRPKTTAVSVDTLPGVPEGARRDTARMFWTYCVR